MSNKERVYIGNIIRKLRKQKNLTQKDVAIYLGISVQVYSNIEIDRNEPSLSVLIGLAEFFGTTTDSLLGI